MYSEQNNDAKKISYCIGLDVAARMMHMPFDFDKDAFLDAVNTMLNGKRPDISQEEFEKQMGKFSKILQDSKAQNDASNEKTVQEGAAFRAEYEKQDGVRKTASGLLVKVLSEGTGKAPNANDTVRVHYEGKLIGGKVFDSSYQRNEPAEFPLNGVIAGWTEGLQLAREGGKLELVIPPELAYGKAGAGSVIPPEATLIFTVELIKVM
jgi:FKBP-type peptidyl-prolyl cis-trans isomerase FklB